MNVRQNRNAAKGDRQPPGCLGMMGNLFDVTSGLGSNKLLTDRPHNNGPAVGRSLSDVSVTADPLYRDQVEHKKTMSDIQRHSSNKNSNVTPIKMLIAQEMSKEVHVKHSPPTLVAKLMGLDALPLQPPKSINQRRQWESLQQSRSLSHSGRTLECSQHERSLSDDHTQHQINDYLEYSEYKDVYEIWQQSQSNKPKKEKSPVKGRCVHSLTEKKMALVREKFMEAKRLAPDEKLRQSKEFHDAVEVLCSNKDIFLKFLQEPNSLFSKHMHDHHSIPSPPETKRITILKPTKMVDSEKLSTVWKKSENLATTPSQNAQGMRLDQSILEYSSPYAGLEVEDYATQPTRIVVLKPGHGKDYEIKSMVPPRAASPGALDGDKLPKKDDEDNEIEETRQLAEEITLQVCENLTGLMRDETMLSSVFSNGYIGDESSFNRSENEYLDGNLSDSEVVTPTSRHSWDFINRTSSPYSTSSLSRSSYSPESSVCKEAKKRLSERWALMALNQNSTEQRQAWKSSGTLGEMLALSDAKKSVKPEENGDNSNDQESAQSSSSLATGWDKEEASVDAPKNLPRSKSVPASATVCDDQLNGRVPDTDISKSGELTKMATGKSSKWKVSNLFFSRSKKSSKDMTSHSEDESRLVTAEAASLSEKAGAPVSNLGTGSLTDNHEQPSPVSVLDPSFEEDVQTVEGCSGKLVSSQLKSNLIDKSPLIGSLARTLLWDESFIGDSSPCFPRNQTTHLSPSDEVKQDEQDWLLLVRTLLSAACLEGEDPSIANWNSPESPLDPSMREKYAALDLDDKGPLPEAKRRQRRSGRKLLFDCVNATVIEMKGHGGVPISAELVWDRMKEWFAMEADDDEISGCRDSVVVDTVVRHEVVGTWWIEHRRAEMESVGLEIELNLLHELVNEAVSNLSSGTA